MRISDWSSDVCSSDLSSLSLLRSFYGIEHVSIFNSQIYWLVVKQVFTGQPARDLPAPANPHRSGGRMDRRSGGYVRRTQEERRQESESRLLAAAVKLIAEKGANGFTLAEVGHEAGYSHSRPGQYLETKETLTARGG